MDGLMLSDSADRGLVIAQSVVILGELILTIVKTTRIRIIRVIMFL